MGGRRRGCSRRTRAAKGAGGGSHGPIEAGETLVLYGTGLRNAAAKPVCTIGGQAVDVLYAGPQGEFPGLDQVNLFVPTSLRGIGAVVLELVVDGVAANPLSVTIR